MVLLPLCLEYMGQKGFGMALLWVRVTDSPKIKHTQTHFDSENKNSCVARLVV